MDNQESPLSASESPQIGRHSNEIVWETPTDSSDESEQQEEFTDSDSDSDTSGEFCEVYFLEELKHFSERAENFALHFPSISHQLCELLSTKSAEDYKFINKCLDEWLRIAQVAPERAKMALFDMNIIEFQKFAELLFRIGCFSMQLKILEILFEYALYGYDIDGQKRISSLFKELVDDPDDICDLIESEQSFSKISRQLLNMLNGKDLTKVESKRIKSFFIDPFTKLITTSRINKSYVDFNFGTKTMEFTVKFDDHRAFQVSIDDRRLQSVWVKDDEIDSVEKLTFVLVKPLSQVWKSEEEQEHVHLKLKEFVIEICDKVDHDEMETFLQEIFPGKFKIMVTAMVHAEKDYEAGVVHSPVCNKSVRPKLPPKQENLDDIFSVPANINWRIISKDLDFYRQTIEKPQTFSTCDAENNNKTNLYSPSKQAEDSPNETDNLINTTHHHGLSKESNQKCQMNEIPSSKLNPTTTHHAAALNQEWLKSGDRKRKTTILHDRSVSKRTRKMKQIDSSENDNDDSDEENVQHRIPQKAIYRTKLSSALEVNHAENQSIKGLNPLSESNRCDDFDMILNTPSYEHGKQIQNVRASFSYLTSSSYSKRSTMDFEKHTPNNSDSD